MSVVAFIQARIGSSRLPGKVMMDLGGKPVIARVIERVRKASGIDEVVVVTTFDRKDLPIVCLCAEAGLRIFCGSENDVLDRFYQAARLIEPDHVIRVTADCPVLDPMVIEKTLALHLLTSADYTSNTFAERFPDGEDVEVMTFAALQTAWKQASLLSEREHVTPYIRKHPELFRHASLVGEKDYSSMRWTLDTEKDYRFLVAIYEALGTEKPSFGMDDILEFIGSHPDLVELNSGIGRNEGLAKSLREDQMVGGRDI